MFDRFIQPVKSVLGKTLSSCLLLRVPVFVPLFVRNAVTRGSGAIMAIALVSPVLSPVLPLSAATLGEMNISSSRGEHLLAEVAVNDVAASEAGSLSVIIADAELVAAAGLVQSENLPFLWAEIRQRESGWYIQLLSGEPIVDPYNEIILELVWDGGSYLREYALRFGGTTRVAEKPADKPAEKPLPSNAATPSTISNAAVGSSNTGVSGSSGRVNGASTPRSIRVNRGDNLLQIVRGLPLPPNVTPEQAMWGIYSANTRSFSGSPNQLLAGVKLQIPAMQRLASISQQVAIAGLKTGSAGAPPVVKQPAPTPTASTQSSVTQSPVTESQVTGSGQNVSLRDPSIALYQAEVQSASDIRPAVSEATNSLSLTRVVKTDSISDVVTRQESRARVEQTLDQLNASIADVRADISGVENSVSSLSSNLGSNVGRVEELRSLITEIKQNQVGAPTSAATATTASVLSAVTAKSVDSSAVAGISAKANTAETNKVPDSALKNSDTRGVSFYVQRFMDSTYLRSLALLSLALLLALFLVTRQLMAQRRKTRQLAAGSRVKPVDSSEMPTESVTGSGKVYSAAALATGGGAQSGSSVLRMQEEVVDAPTALSWFREHLRSGRVSELDLVKALRRYPNRQDLRLRLMERYANRQEVESFAQLAREMFHLTRGRNKEWPRAIQLGLALELEMEAMEPHLARPFETADFGIERDIESPYAGDSTLQFPDRRSNERQQRPASATTLKRRQAASPGLQPDVMLDKTIAI